MIAAEGPCRNLLLNSLSAEDFAFLEPRLERVPLRRGDVIASPDEEVSSVCFPECGVTSITDVWPSGKRVEVALIGREGMTNSQILLGVDQAPHEALVQIGGDSSLRLSREDLRDFCQHSPAAMALFLRYIHALALQTSRTLSSNLLDSVEKRLARWLLMCHDRVDGDEIDLNHDHIGRMLGVRRATITDTVHVLQGAGAIRNTRGHFVVRDRISLERLAGDSYGFAETRYCAFVAPFGKTPRTNKTSAYVSVPHAGSCWPSRNEEVLHS